MPTLTISDRIKVTIESRATAEGFSTPEAYLEALVEADWVSATTPEHLKVSTHDQAVALIREGMTSTARTMTQSDLDGWRNDLVSRHSPKAG